MIRCQLAFPNALAAVLILEFFAIAVRAGIAQAPQPPKAPSAAPDAAPDKSKYDLRYKLATGDVLRFEVSHRASIRSTIDDTTQAAQTRTDSVKSWRVQDVLPNGEIEFLTIVERVHMINRLPEKDPTEYNSERDNTPPPGFEDAARSVGVPLSLVRIAPSGKVLHREAKLKRAKDDVENGPITVLLPEKPVTIGDTWDEPFNLTVITETGGTKLVQTRRHYKLAAVEGGVAKITVEYQVLTPIDAHIESQLVQRLMNGEVKFDIAAGRIVSQQMDIDRRILGFAGPTSSMHYIVRMEEKLLASPEKTATSATEAAPAKSAGETAKPDVSATPADKANATATSDKKPASSTPRTASRPRTTAPNRANRRR
jgi:hypothetical protein